MHQTTLDQLKAYELDKSESIHPEKTKIIEFDDLNKTVSHLTDRNSKVFLRQKKFIENASHELQTPLSIFQSKLDNLMQIPGLAETGAATILDLPCLFHNSTCFKYFSNNSTFFASVALNKNGATSLAISFISSFEHVSNTLAFSTFESPIPSFIFR